MTVKRRRIATPTRLPVETIWWHDASSIERAKIADNLEPVMFMNTGVVTKENAIEITMTHSVECIEDWDTDNHDGYKIPRYGVVKRVRHGYAEVIPAEVIAYKERINEEAPSEGETDATSPA